LDKILARAQNWENQAGPLFRCSHFVLGCDAPILFRARSAQDFPERAVEITVAGEPVVEEFGPEHGQGAVKNRAVPLGEMEPAIALRWIEAGDVEDQRG
jgi:hypothetical protein